MIEQECFTPGSSVGPGWILCSHRLRFKRIPDRTGHSWQHAAGGECNYSVAQRGFFWICSVWRICICLVGARVHLFFKAKENFLAGFVCLAVSGIFLMIVALKLKSIRDSGIIHFVLAIVPIRSEASLRRPFHGNRISGRHDCIGMNDLDNNKMRAHGVFRMVTLSLARFPDALVLNNSSFAFAAEELLGHRWSGIPVRRMAAKGDCLRRSVSGNSNQ